MRRSRSTIEYKKSNYNGLNIEAKKENSVLIPYTDRNRYIWDAPTPKTHTYGFGQAIVLYAKEEKAKNYLERLLKNINEYDGENDIYKILNEVIK